MKQGAATKADLRLVDVGQGPLVVKDFRSKAAWVRAIGRLQIARECGAYRWLGAMAGLPRFVGRIDAHALAVEWIDGKLPAFQPDRFENGPATHEKLREVVERMHAAGLVHLDLRGKDNVVLGSADRLYVLDLASAAWFRPRGWFWRRFSRHLTGTDRAALLKWKRILGVQPYTAEEEEFLRRYRFWRALWIFNRKRRAD